MLMINAPSLAYSNFLAFGMIGKSEGETLLLVVFCLWMLVVLVVGFYASKFAKSTEGFFLGDRKMGSWVTSISSTASSESGWLLLGAVGEAYLLGLQALWIAVGCLLGYAFNWFIFADAIRKDTKSLGAITVPEYLEMKVKDKTHVIRVIGVLVILFLMFTYVAAQMNAAGKSLHAIFGMDYRLGVLVGGLITVIYTMMGGYRAVSWTDLVQGLLMVTALVIMPITAVFYLGGPQKMAEKLVQSKGGKALILKVEGSKNKFIRLEEKTLYIYSQGQITTQKESKPYAAKIIREGENFFLETENTKGLHIKGKTISQGRTSLSEGDEIIIGKTKIAVEKILSLTGGKNLLHPFGGKSGLALLGFVIGMLGIGLGYPGSPHVITRYMSAQSKKEILQGRLIAITWGVLSMYGAIFMGMAARVLFPHIIDPETAILQASVTLLHPALAGIILAAVISAILSTADSQLLVAASAVCRDMYQKVFSRKDISEETMVKISRMTVLLLGIFAILLALAKSRIVFWFVLFSWAGLGATFGPVLILSLFWKGIKRQGIIGGMLTGILTTVVWKIYIKKALAKIIGFELYELVPAFLLSLVVTVILSATESN